MDLAGLNHDAQGTLRRARDIANERGLVRPTRCDILIGLLDSTEARQLLEIFKVEPGKVRSAVAFLAVAESGQEDPDAEERTVEFALAEAVRLGDSAAGSEHLVLALAGQSGSVAAGILESMGVILDSARKAVSGRHGHRQDGGPSTTRSP